MEMASLRSLKSAIFDREERKQHYQAHIRGLNAYEKHKKFVNDYVKYYGKEIHSQQKFPAKTDQDALREGYRFIRTEEDDTGTSWEQRLVKRYYDKLFKEYCIADMSKYKSGKIGLRWRTEKEVISGKGQFVCGNKHCDDKNGLASYEVNFSYFEAGESKQALVKLVACEGCAVKLQCRRKREKQLERCEGEYERKREVLRSAGERETDDEGKISVDGKRPRSVISEYLEEEHSRIHRQRFSGDGTTHEEVELSKQSERKGKHGPTSGADHDLGDDEIDEYLTGMFP